MRNILDFSSNTLYHSFMMTTQEIKTKLSTDPRWVDRALIELTKRQTAMEQASKATINRNDIGYQPCDARMFTSFGHALMQGRKLSPKQYAYCGLRVEGYTGWVRQWCGQAPIAKYARQVEEMIQAKAAALAAALQAKETSA